MAQELNTGYVYAGVTRWLAGTQNGFFRLAHGQARWQCMSLGLPADVFVMCITVHPVHRATVYIGTQFGVVRSQDHGSSWTQLPLAPGPVQVWSLTVHPTRPDTLWAGTSPLGMYRSDDAGQSWQLLSGACLPNRLDMGSFRNRVMRITVDHHDPQALCAVMEVNGAMRSRDGGQTWQDGSDSLVRLADDPRLRSHIITEFDAEGMLDMHAVCSTPAAPNHVFAACRMGIFRSADGGLNWEDLRVDRFSPLSYARDIRPCPHDPQVLYATLNVSSSGPTGTIWRSADLGQSWSRFDHGISPSSTLMALAIDPRDSQVVHVASRVGQVFGTHDGGRSWQALPLPQGCLGTYALAGG